MKLLYVYDALCGWCYGFAPVVEEFVEKYKDEIEPEVISGGMITGERIGPIGQVAGYISEAYKKVEQTTGVRFGEAFLKGILAEGSTRFTSVPPAVAMSIFKTELPEQDVAFAGLLQRAIYYDGQEPEDLKAYARIAGEFGLDEAEFLQKMGADEYLERTQSDFQLAAQLQVSGFPSLFLIEDNKAVLFARGYTPLEQLEQQYAQAAAHLATA